MGNVISASHQQCHCDLVDMLSPAFIPLSAVLSRVVGFVVCLFLSWLQICLCLVSTYCYCGGCALFVFKHPGLQTINEEMNVSDPHVHVMCGLTAKEESLFTEYEEVNSR